MFTVSVGWGISRNMHSRNITGHTIIYRGIILMHIRAVLFTVSLYLNLISPTNIALAIPQTLLWLCIIMTGRIIPNCLSAALENYGRFAGTAASLFSFIYYIIGAGFTWIMGMLPNGKLIQLPIFLLTVSGIMVLVFNVTLKNYFAKKRIN